MHTNPNNAILRLMLKLMIHIDYTEIDELYTVLLGFLLIAGMEYPSSKTLVIDKTMYGLLDAVQ